MNHLFKHQRIAVEQLKNGSILCGGVGSGKTITAIHYFFIKECGGDVENFLGMRNPRDLYIITTAAKRDTLDWERECASLSLSKDRDCSIYGIKVTVDSWNNIKKYIDVANAFFIFDEQRLVGSGVWVKSFYKIAKKNNWILLSATPGDTWMDYVPVFVANGFYKNKTEFIRNHVVFNTFTKYPKIDRYVETDKLERLKNQITVKMSYLKPTKSVSTIIQVSYDKDKMDLVLKKRWNPYSNLPVKEISEYCYTMRRVVNSDISRLDATKVLIEKHRRVIIFYNFDYELYILRTLKDNLELGVAEHNGHKHESIPETESWAYLVQYMSGSEGWNCIEANTVIFYSMNYSYRTMIQAAGRIDRLNTPFSNLYYYHLRSDSKIDKAISIALNNKKNFNESEFKFS